MKKMAWRRSYDFTPRAEENEFDSSDESDSEGGTEPLQVYHRRKSTVTAVKARVGDRCCCCKYFVNRRKIHSISRVMGHSNVL